MDFVLVSRLAAGDSRRIEIVAASGDPILFAPNLYYSLGVSVSVPI